ncbi:MAG: hypothetical protein WCH43_03580, partial [Verrucomicrobiota bacterium]
GEGLLAYRIGKFKSAKDYLQPWIQGIVAACAGHSMPVCVVDEENLGSPVIMKEQAPGEAVELLGHLVDGFLQGQGRPLCYAPATSDAYAKACEPCDGKPNENALKKAADKWIEEPFNSSPGEGFSTAAKLAWRDQDPFAFHEEWHHWACAIAKPLHVWFTPKKPKKS